MPLSDIVFLDGHTPVEVEFSDEPYSLGTWFHAKNICLIKLSILGELLSVSSYDELMDGFAPLNPDDDESFLLSIPESLQDRVRSLTDEEISGITPKWAANEEFYGHETSENLAIYLKSLRDFLNTKSGYAALYFAP